MATDDVELDFGPFDELVDDAATSNEDETTPFAEGFAVGSQLRSQRPRVGVIVVALGALLALGVMLLTDADEGDESVEAIGSSTTLAPARSTTSAPTIELASNAALDADQAAAAGANEEADTANQADTAIETDESDAVDETGVEAASPASSAAPRPSLPGRTTPVDSGTPASGRDADGQPATTPASPTTAPPSTTGAPATPAPTTTSPATTTPPPAAGGTPGQGAAVWNYYGNPWVPSHLANLTLRGNERYSYRFVAKSTGVMSGFQNYMQANTSRTGYAGGDGGTIRFRLVPDDGSGRPNESTVLTELLWSPNLRNGSALPAGSNNYTDSHPISFADKFWTSKPTLTAGQKYHLVIENVDADNTSNYISINNPYAINGWERSPLGPQVGDWGVVADEGGGWSDYTEPYSGTRYEVNLVILMENGNHYGNNYMDSRSSHTISGGNELRQLFTPARTRSVDQLAVFTSGSGVLRATLRQGNTTVGTWTASVSGARHSVFDIGSIQLNSGTSYSVEFSADSGSFDMLTFRDGSVGNGYPYPAGGSWDGHAQQGSGGSWSDTFYTYADVAGVAFRTR